MIRNVLGVLLATTALTFLGTLNGNAQTYTFDGRTLQRWQGDPNTLHVEEWQIWLYKRGQQTGGLDHWGSVSASSAIKAKAQLLSGQAFEVSYCKFFGHPSDCEKNMTYFNPFGPVAIMKADKTVSQRIVTDLWSMKEDGDQLKKLMDLYIGLEAAYNPYSYHGTPDEANPFSGIGTFVLDYGASLKAAADKFKLASEQIISLNNSNERVLESSLDQFDAVASNQTERVTALAADSTEIQSRYDTLLKEGALKPAAAGGASWMHTVYDDGDGDQIKKITIDVMTRPGVLIVRQVNLRSDSTETVETQLPLANIRFALVEPVLDQPAAFGLAESKSYIVKVRGNASTSFSISDTTKSNSGQVQQSSSSSFRYIFTFNDEDSANACADFINKQLGH